MHKLFLILSLAFAIPVFSFDFKAQKDKMVNKVKGHAEDAKRDVTSMPTDIVAGCKSEMENLVACKGNKAPDTMKTCLVAHKEQLSQGCKSSLGI